MTDDVAKKFCPLIRENCRTDCMYLTMVTKENFECALIYHIKDIGLAVGSIDNHLKEQSEFT